MLGCDSANVCAFHSMQWHNWKCHILPFMWWDQIAATFPKCKENLLMWVVQRTRCHPPLPRFCPFFVGAGLAARISWGQLGEQGQRLCPPAASAIHSFIHSLSGDSWAAREAGLWGRSSGVGAVGQEPWGRSRGAGSGPSRTIAGKEGRAAPAAPCVWDLLEP